jgi:hypothetical protein
MVLMDNDYPPGVYRAEGLDMDATPEMIAAMPLHTSRIDHLYDPTTLQARVDEGLKHAIDPKLITGYKGEDMAIEDIPDPAIRSMMGYGHPAYDVKHFEHLTRRDNVPWSYTPETCLIAGNLKGVWIDSDHLVCPGCGLDYT